MTANAVARKLAALIKEHGRIAIDLKLIDQASTELDARNPLAQFALTWGCLAQSSMSRLSWLGFPGLPTLVYPP